MARNKYDVDEVLEDKFDLNQLKRLLAYLIPYRKRFVSVGFMMLSASAFTMLIPQFFQKVMDVCIPNKDMKGIAFYSFLTLLAAFYSAFSLRYKIKYTNQIGQQIIHDMRYDIFEHLQELPFSYLYVSAVFRSSRSLSLSSRKNSVLHGRFKAISSPT